MLLCSTLYNTLFFIRVKLDIRYEFGLQTPVIRRASGVTRSDSSRRGMPGEETQMPRKTASRFPYSELRRPNQFTCAVKQLESQYKMMKMLLICSSVLKKVISTSDMMHKARSKIRKIGRIVWDVMKTRHQVAVVRNALSQNNQTSL